MDTLGNLNTGVEYCMKLSSNISQVEESYDCAENVRFNFYAECSYECPVRCHEFRYKWKLANSKWPMDPFSQTFYDVFIKDQPFENRCV